MVGNINHRIDYCINPIIIKELYFLVFFVNFLKNDQYWKLFCDQKKILYTQNFVFLEQLADRLFKEIIVIFSNVVANIENKRFLKILSEKTGVSSKNLIFMVTCRPDRHSKLVVTCLLELPDDVGSKNFWPINVHRSRKLIVCKVQKPWKSHVDFGHPLRKIAVTSRPLPRSGSNLQGTLIGTSSTRFLSQLKNFSSDPPTLKGQACVFVECYRTLVL